MTENSLTQERLKELFDYYPISGIFKRKKSQGNCKSGSIAKNIDSCGYIRIGIDHKRYLAHRLAWLYVYGCFPEIEIDHINHCRIDNRITNLRLSTRRENSLNASRSSSNKSGFTGVMWNKHANKWVSKIQVCGEFIHLGYFKDFNDAVKARKSANIKYSFHENHGA